MYKAYHFSIQDGIRTSPTFPPHLAFLETYIYVSVPDKSCRELEEYRQGYTEHGKAQAQVKRLKRQVVLFIVWWIHTHGWEFCVWKRKGNCITKIIGACNP